jgi:hypothetical protein
VPFLMKAGKALHNKRWALHTTLITKCNRLLDACN